MRDLNTSYRYLSFAVKYSSVLFPFDQVQFLKALSREGFIVSVSPDTVAFGQKLQLTGSVGRKGDVQVILYSDKRVLSVHVQSGDVKTLVTEMASLEALLKREFYLESQDLSEYYEFLATLVVKAEINPLTTWGSLSTEISIVNEASEALGREVSLFGIKLVPKLEVPNQTNWFSLSLEPSIESPKSHHNVEVVFRDASSSQVIGFVTGFEDLLKKLLSLVERG